MLSFSAAYSKTKMINRILLLACFLSGAASLFYQILWTRAFSLMLGSTIQAAALIFAAFLTGLAIGAWLFGRFSARLRRPLLAYVVLELGIAVAAVATGLILHHNADSIGAFLGDGATKYTLVFLLAVGMILPPTLLMGGTLPIVLTIAQRNDSRLSIVGRFYGWNTFGAAVGTLVCGFVSIRLLGITSSYYTAMALNLSVALMCALLLAVTRPVASNCPPERSATPRADVLPVPESFLLLIAGMSGALVLSLEVIWARMAGFFLGNRTYAFTLLMFTVLTLLAVGAWLSAKLYNGFVATPSRDPYRVFGNLLALSASAVVVSAAGGWWLIANQVELEANLPDLQTWILGYRFVEAFALLALPLIFLGILFPLAIALSRHCADNIGGTTARYYVVNALGIVVGSLGTGFIGVSYLGSFGMFKLLVAALLLLTCYSVYRSGRPLPVFASVIGMAALGAVLLLPATYPAGLRSGEEILLEVEDEHGVFRATKLRNQNLRVTNNRSELVFHLGAFSTDYVQQMQGHLAIHFNPGARAALVIGSGYGITAGALASYEMIEHVDAVEILPAMVSAADMFMPHNLNYHNNPKVQLTVDDGRHFLVRQNQQYDIISLNVSDPHMPGGSTLFHTEFYDLAKRHLRPGGVLVQHAFGSELAIIARTLAASFPFILFSESYSNGYNVVAAMHPLEDRVGLQMDLPATAVRQLRISARGRPIIRPKFLNYDQLPPNLHTDIVASDDFPAVEFSWNPGLKTLFINE
tara:strand:+ start:42138 stop:44399 length:2262 start_codon:yes stop_codon:yes gene_type:complete